MTAPRTPHPATLTCWSCHHYRLIGCALHNQGRPVGFPKLGPDFCAGFVYEPGSDESERQPEDIHA